MTGGFAPYKSVSRATATSAGVTLPSPPAHCPRVSRSWTRGRREHDVSSDGAGRVRSGLLFAEAVQPIVTAVGRK